MINTAYDRLLDALRDHGSKVITRGPNQASAQCSAHEDRNPSLSLTAIEGQALVYCHGGCHTGDVLGALGMTAADLFDEKRGATYRYDSGRVVRRTPDKRFFQSGELAKVELYHLGRLREAGPGEVFLVEGEKDVHAIEAADGVATTAPMGASNFAKVDVSPLAGRHVSAVVDRDDAGAGWAARVAQALEGVVAGLRFVQAATGKDAADHIAAGHTLTDFEPYEPPATEPAGAADPAEQDGDQPVRLPTLPEWFWSKRPILKTIEQAAYAVGYSRDVVLLATLCRTAAMAHHDLKFDFGRGRGSLNLFGCPVGPSGTGKTEGVDAAQELILPPTYLDESFHVRDGIGLGSGEGMAEVFMGLVEEETGETHERNTKNANKGDPKTKTVRAQVHHNVFFYVDEGKTLTKLMMERNGSTVGENLRTAWTGKALGQANAREDTTRLIPKGTYSMGIVIGYQPKIAQALLADGAAGTPQRFLWASSNDPNVPLDPTDRPDPFRLALCDGNGNPETGLITCYPELRRELRATHIAKVRGDVVVDELDSHAPLMRCKLAALLALLDGRMKVTEEDWDLAGVIWDTSCAVRDRLLEYGKQQAAEAYEKATAAYVDREERAHLARAGASNKVERIARWIARRIHEDGPATRGATRKALAGRDKSAFDAACGHAIELGWVVPLDERILTPGNVRPA